MSARLCAPTLIVIAAAPLLLAPDCGKSGAGGGDPQICEDGSAHLEQCGVAPVTSSCDALVTCESSCALETSCDGLSGEDSAAKQAYDDCVADCQEEDPDDPAGSADCAPCADYLSGAATYEQVCPAGQQLLDTWAACLCAGPCEVACFEHCQGYEPNLVCSDCIAVSCQPEVLACQADS